MDLPLLRNITRWSNDWHELTNTNYVHTMFLDIKQQWVLTYGSTVKVLHPHFRVRWRYVWGKGPPWPSRWLERPLAGINRVVHRVRDDLTPMEYNHTGSLQGPQGFFNCLTRNSVAE